jgi:hypothetical protein
LIFLNGCTEPTKNTAENTAENRREIKELARSYYLAIAEGKKDSLAEICLKENDSLTWKVVLSNMEMSAAIRDFNQAIEKAFGSDGKKLDDSVAGFADEIDTAKLSFENPDQAKVQIESGASISLVRENGSWKVDLRQAVSESVFSKRLAETKQFAEGISEIATMINDGVLDSPASVKRAVVALYSSVPPEE